MHRQNRSLNNFKERLDTYEKKVRQTEQNIIDQLSKIALDDAANQAAATALPLSTYSSVSIALLKSSDITVAQETNKDAAKEIYHLWKKLLDTYGANIYNLVDKLGKWVEDGVEDVEEFWEKVKNSPEYQNACSNATEEPEVPENSAEEILLDDLQKLLEQVGQIPVYGDKADFVNEVINLVRGTEPEEVTAEELLESSIDEMQAKLDAVGIAPVVGDAADAVNSVIYAVRGKKKDALISGISMISLIGDVSKVGKYTTKGVKTASKIADATLELIDDIVDIVKVSNKLSDPEKFINKVEKVGEVVEDAAKGGSGTKIVNGFEAKVNVGQQEKHIPGTNNYKNEIANGKVKSTINGDANDVQRLLDEKAGTGTMIGNNKERVNFGEVIGQYVDPNTGIATDTTVGIIHYGKNGAHIVPARPN